MRINTGRWGTIKSFDDFMAKKGIEPTLDGHTDDEAFKWVIDSLEKLLPRAEECGVVLGLENHWGLGRTAEGVLKIVEAIRSPWLQITLDTGNFLENSYEQMEMMASARSRWHWSRPRHTTAAADGTRSTSTTPGSPASCASIITAAGSRSNSKATRSRRPAYPRAWRC